MDRGSVGRPPTVSLSERMTPPVANRLLPVAPQAIAFGTLAVCLAVLPACTTLRDAQAPQAMTNSLGMQFVRVPAGRFLMGSDKSPATWARDYPPPYEARRFEELIDEAPVHPVTIGRAFWLGRHEVTIGQFRAFLERSGHTPESIADGTGGYGYNPAYDPAASARGDAFEGRDPKYDWAHPGFAQTDDHPVLNVTWNDAVALARWLSGQENAVYRLPTEAEWEYACRAGTTSRDGDGDGDGDEASSPLKRTANVFDADAAVNWPAWQGFAARHHDGYAFTAPVGRFEPNAFGLYDMLGNAWEWTADWYGERYYAQSPPIDPQGPTEGSVRVRRGGSWHTWPLYARCGYRNWNSPQTRYVLVGLRLLRELDGTE